MSVDPPPTLWCQIKLCVVQTETKSKSLCMFQNVMYWIFSNQSPTLNVQEHAQCCHALVSTLSTFQDSPHSSSLSHRSYPAQLLPLSLVMFTGKPPWPLPHPPPLLSLLLQVFKIIFGWNKISSHNKNTKQTKSLKQKRWLNWQNAFLMFQGAQSPH